MLTILFNYNIIKLYQTNQTKMAKTRTITATFPNGDQVTRKTARTYTHVVRAFDKEQCWFLRWCGRPDLMKKQIRVAENYHTNPIEDGIELRIEVAEVTNDPWAE